MSSCADAAVVTVLPVDPGACGNINIGVSSVGSDVLVSFLKPGPAGVGIDLDRGTSAQLATPITTLGINIVSGDLTGVGIGAATSITDATGFGGTLDYYLASCDSPGPKSSGNQRIGGAPSARFQNP